jgi:hypothetical protein
MRQKLIVLAALIATAASSLLSQSATPAPPVNGSPATILRRS